MSDKQWVFDNPQEAADLIEQLQRERDELEESIEIIKQQRDSYRHERTALAIQNEKLEKERDELEATAEQLREIIGSSSLSDDPHVMSALNATPQDNLNAIKREVVFELSNYVKRNFVFSPPRGNDHDKQVTALFELMAMKYANTKYPTEGE